MFVDQGVEWHPEAEANGARFWGRKTQQHSRDGLQGCQLAVECNWKWGGDNGNMCRGVEVRTLGTARVLGEWKERYPLKGLGVEQGEEPRTREGDRTRGGATNQGRRQDKMRLKDRLAQHVEVI